MRRFRFRPERVERLRRLELDEARARLVSATAECDALRDGIAEMQRRSRAAAEQLQRRLAPGCSAESQTIRSLGERLQVIARSIENLARAEREAAEHETACRIELDRARRAHRVLVRLKERRKRRWRLAAEREEQLLLDELHLLRTGGDERRRERTS